MTTYRPKNSTVFVYDFVLKGTRHHGSTGCKTKREADAVEARERGRIALDSGHRRKPFISLNEAADHYANHLRTNGKWSNDAERWIATLVDVRRHIVPEPHAQASWAGRDVDALCQALGAARESILNFGQDLIYQ